MQTRSRRYPDGLSGLIPKVSRGKRIESRRKSQESSGSVGITACKSFRFRDQKKYFYSTSETRRTEDCRSRLAGVLLDAFHGLTGVVRRNWSRRPRIGRLAPAIEIAQS